jgi:hypothetical protein
MAKWKLEQLSGKYKSCASMKNLTSRYGNIAARIRAETLNCL